MSKKTPSGNGGHSNADIAEAMLHMAFGPSVDLPGGDESIPAHLAGISVAAFVVRAARADVNHLLNQIDVCIGEVRCERVFNLAKLKEHRWLLGELLLLLEYATTGRIQASKSNPVKGSANVLKEPVQQAGESGGMSDETVNLKLEALEILNEENMDTYGERITKAKLILEHQVLVPIKKMVGRIRANEEADEKRAIRTLLNDQVVPELFRDYSLIWGMRKNMDWLVSKVLGIWEDIAN